MVTKVTVLEVAIVYICIIINSNKQDYESKHGFNRPYYQSFIGSNCGCFVFYGGSFRHIGYRFDGGRGSFCSYKFNFLLSTLSNFRYQYLRNKKIKEMGRKLTHFLSTLLAKTNQLVILFILDGLKDVRLISVPIGYERSP